MHPRQPESRPASAVSAAGSLDVSGLVRKARRRADLSQRGLADVLGVDHTRITRLENGGSKVDVAQLERILALGGLRLAVVDALGAEVVPAPDIGFRDRAGRRVPAHLDVLAPSESSPSTRLHPKPDRPEPIASFEWRLGRDLRRRRRGLAGDDEQLTPIDLARLRADRRRESARRSPLAFGSAEECRCPIECWETEGCTEACGCRCETG